MPTCGRLTRSFARGMRFLVDAHSRRRMPLWLTTSKSRPRRECASRPARSERAAEEPPTAPTLLVLSFLGTDHP
jgi:hypothetical protein